MFHHIGYYLTDGDRSNPPRLDFPLRSYILKLGRQLFCVSDGRNMVFSLMIMQVIESCGGKRYEAADMWDSDLSASNAMAYFVSKPD